MSDNLFVNWDGSEIFRVDANTISELLDKLKHLEAENAAMREIVEAVAKIPMGTLNCE